MNKNVAVIISGGIEDNLRDVTLTPGSTAQDVLRTIGLDDGYLLSREGSAQSFAQEETIFEAVPDGGKLRATPITEVGCVGPFDGHGGGFCV